MNLKNIQFNSYARKFRYNFAISLCFWHTRLGIPFGIVISLSSAFST